MTWTGESDIKAGPLARGEVEAMLQQAGADYTVRRVPENAILFWAGEPHKLHYFVVSGLIELYADDEEGRRKTIDFYGPGSFFSYMFLREGNEAMTTARACMDSQVITLTKTAFFQALHNNPSFAEATVQSLFELLRMQTNEVIRASFYSATRRCALLLASLSQGHPAGEPLGYDNVALADMLGVSRNSVTAAVSQLQKAGAIRKDRAGIVVVDAARLERLGRTGRA